MNLFGDFELAAGDRHAEVVDEGSELTIDQHVDFEVSVNEATTRNHSCRRGKEGLA